MPPGRISDVSFSLTQLKTAVNYDERQRSSGTGKSGLFQDTRIIVGKNGKPVRSPTTFWNRNVAWIRGERETRNEDVSVRQRENAEFKADVFNLLLKAEGREHTERAFARVLGRDWALSGGIVKRMTTTQTRKIIALTEKLRLRSRRDNTKLAGDFVNEKVGNWSSLFSKPGVNLSSVPTDSRIQNAVLRAVADHPDYSRRTLSQSEVESIALDTLQTLTRESTERIGSEFPELSGRFSGPPAPTTTDYLKSLRDLFSEGGPSQPQGRLHNVPFREDALSALEQIESASRSLQEVHFDVGKSAGQLTQLNNLRDQLEQTRERLLSVNVGNPEEDVAADSAAALQRALVMETTNQISRIDSKTRAITDYLNQDPLSDKLIYRPRAIWAQAVVLQGEEIIADIRKQIDQEPDTEKSLAMEWQVDQFAKRLHTWERNERNFQNGIEPGVRSMDERKRNEALSTYNKKWARTELMALAKNERSDGTPVHDTHITRLSRSQRSRITASELKRRRLDVLHRPDNWQVSTRTVTASRKGVTQTFLEENTPLSVSGNINSRRLGKLGIGGLVPESRGVGTAPVNSRTARLYAIDDRTGHRQMIQERQQHAIVDHWKIGNRSERRRANQESARMLITESITSDREFLEQSIDQSLNRPFTLYYVNSNETSPNSLNELNSGHSESTYSDEQSLAFYENCGTQQFTVDDPRPQGKQERKVKVNVAFIDFRFPVNYAIDGNFSHKAFTLAGRVWAGLGDHNRKQLGMLVGNLSEGSRIEGALGNTMRGLERIVQLGEGPEATEPQRQDAAQARVMMARIQRHADNLRRMLNRESYRSAPHGDRFKAPRELDLLTNAWRLSSAFQEKTENGGQRRTRVISAGNCMSAKDREGNTGQESKAAAIIEHMGGRVTPGVDFENEEDRVINNTMLTGGVINTARVTSFGGGKNTKEHPRRMLGDTETNILSDERREYESAYDYSKGTSDRAKT